MTLTVGSLFSGIGGLDLGLERAGMNVIWQSEIDPYACKVLSKHWPKVPNHGNIKHINWGDIVQPDVICGGYPCQPFSVAGNRQGEDDPRHLWPWVREAISQLRPKYAILENVRGHVTLGLSSVLGDLASIGYDAQWNIVSAASVGAPHQRERLFVIAYPSGQRLQGHLRAFQEAEKTNVPTRGTWWSTESRVCGVAHGIPKRMDRLKGLGNAVVPQVAEIVGRMVIDYDTNK
jgi:DNA (cytosine-5)-methyltransferase 1